MRSSPVVALALRLIHRRDERSVDIDGRLDTELQPEFELRGEPPAETDAIDPADFAPAARDNFAVRSYFHGAHAGDVRGAEDLGDGCERGMGSPGMV